MHIGLILNGDRLIQPNTPEAVCSSKSPKCMEFCSVDRVFAFPLRDASN